MANKALLQKMHYFIFHKLQLITVLHLIRNLNLI